MRNLKKWMLAATLICGTTMVLTSCHTEGDDIVEPANPESGKSEAVDYSDKNNWMRQPEATKDVDVFFIYPTEYEDYSDGAPLFAAIDEPAMRIPAESAYLKNATAFEESANVYAPYYRQCNNKYMATLSVEERAKTLQTIPQTDIFAALDYFFENLNNGRPFILASHSQGSIIMTFVLAEYMKNHPEYYERMIAAYVIGYSITEDYLKANPHLKFAEGADDTGVIISYNTEGPGNGNSTVVLPGAISINPLNWKRDDTYASAEENLGSRIFNIDKMDFEVVPHGADAQVDLKRGVVISTTKIVEPEKPGPFGTTSLHENDYPLYYFNIQANAAARIAAYKKAMPVDYSDKNNWMRQPEATKDVDAFFVYPTEYDDPSEGAPKFAPIDEPAMRQPAEYAYLKIATAFEDCSNVFAPYYRQGNMSYLGKISAEERNVAFNSLPKTDILAAIDYYFKHLNGGRPFILVGHSQGSIMQTFVLSEYMKAHPEYLKRMVAAYVVGYSITEDFLKANPHLKFAEGADDTGVIVSYNTEGAGNGNNIVVLPGAISINPINWKRDETYASAEESLGGRVFNMETLDFEKVPNAADAKIDLKRGVVITTTKAVDPEGASSPFGAASFHENDYPLYYYNIKANAAARIAAYKAN